MDKVQIIEDSRRCYARGLVGLVPLLGLPFAVHALFIASRVERDARGQWNPARRYVTRGIVLGLIGILVTVSACVLAGLVLISAYSQGPD